MSHRVNYTQEALDCCDEGIKDVFYAIATVAVFTLWGVMLAWRG